MADPCMTFDHSNELHFDQGVLPTKFGGHTAFLNNLTSGSVLTLADLEQYR